MHLSQYLKVYPCEEEPGHLVLFSTKKASKILLKKETYRAIEEGTLSPSEEALLLWLGMIVPDREEEARAIDTQETQEEQPKRPVDQARAVEPRGEPEEELPASAPRRGRPRKNKQPTETETKEKED